MSIIVNGEPHRDRIGPRVTYVRPVTIDDALAALARPAALAIGGGTKVNAAVRVEPVVVVDLQALGLDRIDAGAGGEVSIGATTTLQQLADHPAAPRVVREAARREAPSTLRTLTTVAGCVATADPESELLAALLVHGADVLVAGRDGTHTVDLPTLLADRGRLAGRIITAVTIETGGVAWAARTGRTRADRPIVAAVARRTASGELRVALTGVASTPVLVDPGGGLADTIGRLEPPGDFRGSSEYRRMLAGVLAGRALEEVG